MLGKMIEAQLVSASSKLHPVSGSPLKGILSSKQGRLQQKEKERREK